MIAEDTPIGTAVIVTRENGAEVRTVTKARPWWLILRARPVRGKRAANTEKLVVLVEGLSGPFECTRVRLVPERQMDLFAVEALNTRGGRK